MHVSSPTHEHEEQHAPGKLERAATWLSVACAVHCLVVPLLSALMPLLGASASKQVSPATESAIALVVIVTASAAAAWGYRRHRDARVTAAMLTALLLYGVGHTLEATWIGPSLSIASALLLAVASFYSARLSQSCDDENHTH